MLELFDGYEHVLIMYDNDETGIAQMKKLCAKYPVLKPIVLKSEKKYSNCKDISDFIKNGMTKEELDEIVKRAEDGYNSFAQISKNEDPSSTPSFPDSVYHNLPPTLKSICNRFKAREKDIVLLSTLVTLSTVFYNVCGIYDRKRVGLNLFSIIIAPPASGKGAAVWSRRLISEIVKQLRAEYVAEMKQYRDALDAGEKPDKPVARYLCIPANSSTSKVIRTLAVNQKFGLIHESEADTLVNAFKNDWGDFTDLMRKAFEHEPVTMGRIEESFEIERSILSVLLTGTPNQLSSLIKNVENGFFSRFLYYSFVGELKWRNAFTEQNNDLEDFYSELANTVLDWWNNQAEYKDGIKVLLTIQQQNKITDYFDETFMSYVDVFGRDIAASVIRMGLVHYRICMLLTIIRAYDSDWLAPTLTVDDEDFNTATDIVDTLLYHLEAVFKQVSGTSKLSEFTVEQQKFLAALPLEFTKTDYEKVGRNIGISLSGSYKMITKFIKRGVVEQVRRACYRKV